MSIENDISFMKLAIAEARKAFADGEVPVGAIIVSDDKVIAAAHNLRERHADPTAHAEILALREAGRQIGSWRLDRCTMYVTCEPCVMCAGALVWARIERLVFGCMDPKAGACGSLYDIPRDVRLNHRLRVIGGVLSDECSKLMSNFFLERR